MENEQDPYGMLWQWIKTYDPREDKMIKVGIMVGVPIDGDNDEKLFNADYAICNRELDKFDEEKGKTIAYNRAIWARPNRAAQKVVGEAVGRKYPQLILEEEFSDFCYRCKRYFKNRKPTAKAKKVLESWR